MSEFINQGSYEKTEFDREKIVSTAKHLVSVLGLFRLKGMESITFNELSILTAGKSSELLKATLARVGLELGDTDDSLSLSNRESIIKKLEDIEKIVPKSVQKTKEKLDDALEDKILLFFKQHEGGHFSTENIRKDIGKSYPTVRKALESLVEKGLLKRGPTRSNNNILVDHYWATEVK